MARNGGLSTDTGDLRGSLGWMIAIGEHGPYAPDNCPPNIHGVPVNADPEKDFKKTCDALNSSAVRGYIDTLENAGNIYRLIGILQNPKTETERQVHFNMYRVHLPPDRFTELEVIEENGESVVLTLEEGDEDSATLVPIRMVFRHKDTSKKYAGKPIGISIEDGVPHSWSYHTA